MDHPIKQFFDYVAGAVTVAGLLQLIHVVLMVPAAIYMCMRCYEWVEKRRK